MNERERFRRVVRREPVDRPPWFEEGVRDEVLARWHQEGLAPDKTHEEVFGLTPHERVGPDLWPRSAYERRIMEISEREYAQAFDVSRDRFPADWAATVRRLSARDHVVCVWASRGFFQALGVRNWATLEPVLRATLREPAAVVARMEMYADFCSQMLELTLREVEPEFIYLSEPISDNMGPLISPAMFEQFVIPLYQRIVAVAHDHGCREVLVGTYGNSARLFPSWIAAGVSMLWLSEAVEVPDTDYRTIRQQYGPDLGLIGGIPLSLLRADSPEGMRERLSEIVTPLLASGRYIPLVSGRVREEVRWPVYRAYREALNDLTPQTATSAG